MVGKGSKTPGHKGKLNASTPFAATGRKGKGLGRDDRTVDVGALLRGKLQDIKVVPKLRGEQQENQGDNSGSSKRAQLVLEPNSSIDSALPFSPDDSLAAAASKLAHLKASGVGAAAAASARLSAEQSLAEAAAAEAVTEQPQALAAAPECPAVPSAPQSPPLMASPEYQPEASKASDDDESVPLAARTALTKRHRRKSQHQGPERFGDWFTGDDAELDQTLAEYNEKLQEEQRQAAAQVMTRAQRRKSALPAVGRSVQADVGPILRREASADDAANARQDVAARVQAITTDICNQLDGLIQASPREKGRRRQNEKDDKSLHEKLVEAWDGMSYYDRLKAEASKDDESEEEEQQQVQQQQQQLQLPAPLHQRLAQLESSGVDSDAAGETVTTPSRAQQEQQLCELTESLKKLQVSTVNRTSKAAAVLASRVHSAPGSRSGSPNVAAAARGQAAAEKELARAVSAPSAEVAAGLSNANEQQQQGAAAEAAAVQQPPRAKGAAAAAARKRSVSPAKAGARMALAPVRTSLTALKRQTSRQASSPVAGAKRPTSRAVSSPVTAAKRSAAHVASPSAAAAAKRAAVQVASPLAAAAAKRLTTKQPASPAAAAAKRLATKQPSSPAAAAAKRLVTKQPSSPAAAAAKRLTAKQPSSPAAAAAAKHTATKELSSPAASQPAQEGGLQNSGRVTRSKSRSPEPTALVEMLPSRQRGAAPKAGASPLGPASARAAAAGAGQAPNTAGGSISREQSRAELELSVSKATVADEQAKSLQEQLAEERQARKGAEEQAAKLAAELKEESKARKAAERKLEELQRRLDQAEEAERTLNRVAEKAAESTVYHSAAETQMTAILKAANSLMKQLGQGKQEAQALLEMTGGAAETAAALAASKGAAVAAVVPAKAARQQPAGAKPAAAANLQNTGGWR